MCFTLTDYVEHARARATHDKLDDGTYTGGIPHAKEWLRLGGRFENVTMNFPRQLKIGFFWDLGWDIDCRLLMESILN